MQQRQTNSKPVGIFDSGFGGLSIALAIEHQLPNESMIYIADTAYTPYGELTSKSVEQRTLALGEHLQELGAKAIVVACNTATTAAITQLRAQLRVPIIGVEPGIKPAFAQRQSSDKPDSPIAVLATTHTLGANRLKQLVDEHAGDHPVILQPCPGFVEIVEAGLAHTAQALNVVAPIIQPLIEQGVRSFVLGCTHYYFLADIIRQAASTPILLIETSQAVARQLSAQLNAHHLLAQPIQKTSHPNQKTSHRFLCTQLNAKAQTCLHVLWNQNATLELLS